MGGIGIKTESARRQLIAAACVMYAPGHGANVAPDGPPSPFAPAIGGPQQDPLTYGDGPLMLNSKLYLIFWG